MLIGSNKKTTFMQTPQQTLEHKLNDLILFAEGNIIVMDSIKKVYEMYKDKSFIMWQLFIDSYVDMFFDNKMPHIEANNYSYFIQGWCKHFANEFTNWKIQQNEKENQSL